MALASTEIRKTLLDRIAADSRQYMNLYTRRMYEDFIAECPEDARGLNDFARFLLSCHSRRMRDLRPFSPLQTHAS